MLNKSYVFLALSGLLMASTLAIAEEAHHPAEGAGANEASAPSESPPLVGDDMPMGPGRMMMGPMMMGSGMGSGESAPPGSSAMGPGMMMGRQGGGMGMMGGGMGQGRGMGMMGGQRSGGKEGHGMHAKHREMIGRLDSIEARLAKLEFMLERLLQR